MDAAQNYSTLLSFTKQYLMRLGMRVLNQWKLKTQLKSQLMSKVLLGVKWSKITSSLANPLFHLHTPAQSFLSSDMNIKCGGEIRKQSASYV